MGRRKIPIERVEDRSKRYVTFSKRRNGIFSKAAELCMLCDARIAILASSPSENSKVYSFGSPSVDNVIDAFLSKSTPIDIDSYGSKSSFVALHREVRALEHEARVGKAKQPRHEMGWSWWESEDFENWDSIEKLSAYEEAMEKFKDNVMTKLNGGTPSSGITIDFAKASAAIADDNVDVLNDEDNDNDDEANKEEGEDVYK